MIVRVQTLFLLLLGAVCLGGQQPRSDVIELEKRPVFRVDVDVVQRVTVAVNYSQRNGATKIDFKGTTLMPAASGMAKVESRGGYTEIEARFDDMKPALGYGAEYLTYVLWAITPEGRAANLGEILIDDGRAKLNVTTELPVFGMVVTAEPYFAVRQPSDLVVLENEIRPETKGRFLVMDAKYDLLKRGQYQALANPLSLTVNPDIPLELYEARNAVEIARSSGAAEYADDVFLKAERTLQQAEAYQARDAGAKPVTMLAREAVQRAEDARELSVRRYEQERLRLEREDAARREAAARAEAEEEAKRRAEAERQHQERAEAEELAKRRAAQEAAARRRLESELDKARESAQAAEAAARRTMEMLKERTASFGEERARWEQERARREQEEALREQRLRELERAEARVRIYSQLSRVLFTRDVAAGLVVEVPSAFFERGTAQLTSEGREKLALVTGILLANPGLAVEVPTGRETTTEVADGYQLEQARTAALRRYLSEHGLVESRLWRPASVGDADLAPPIDSEVPLEESPLSLIVGGEPIAVPQQLATENQ